MFPEQSDILDTYTGLIAIVLNQQSLSTVAPSSTQQFSHYLSLSGSKSDTQRRDALAFLTTSIASRPVDSPLPQPVSVILPSLLPLILDGNNGVRTQLVKLLKALPAAEMESHVSLLLPYIRAGMTHLASDIRLSSVEILSWLLSAAGNEVVSCEGGWIKTLNCFLSVLGWHTEESAKWSSNRASFGKAGSEGKPIVRALQVFAEFLRAGIGSPDDDDEVMSDGDGDGYGSWGFPLHHAGQYLIPDKSAPFAYLSLFGQPKDEEGEMYETREDRQRVFMQKFRKPVDRGVIEAKNQGGEVGRTSAVLSKVLKEASSDP